MAKRFYELFIILILICFLNACSAKEEAFFIPVNYSADAVVKIYSEKSENTYNVKLVCQDGNYNFNIHDGDINWNMAVCGNKCTLNNEKFMDNSVTIDDFNISDSLISEFDLQKFDNSSSPRHSEIIYWDGIYKHILNFSKENLLPKNIFIYKNDNLVKTIQYNKLDVEY